MGKFDFDDEDNEQEPTFSLHDFKKWLAKQGKGDPNLKNENTEKEKVDPEVEKEQFKDKLRKRRKKG